MKTKTTLWLRKKLGLSKFGRILFELNIEEPKEITLFINAETLDIDWGDGETTHKNKVQAYYSHEFLNPGTYKVVIEGTNIIDFEAKECDLTSLDVSACKTIEFIDCSENQILHLDVRNCRRLFELYCGENGMESLTLCEKLYPKLCYLSCEHNKIKELELRGCKNLINLLCGYNEIETIDVSKCKRLARVQVVENKFDIATFQKIFAALDSKSYMLFNY